MQQLIKITYTDDNEIVTRINGTDAEITSHYALNNELAKASGIPQARRIEYLDPNANYSSKVYLFIDYDGTGILR